MNNKISVTVPTENGWVKEEISVPDDQAWLYHMLDRQTDALKSIRTSVNIMAVLFILGILAAGCNLILTFPIR